VADTDDNGILIDLLGHTVNRLTLMGLLDLRWNVFELDWIQREDGILEWERVCERSRERSYGWPLDENRIRLFHAQCGQVFDGLFVAGSHYVILAAEESGESAIVRSKIALQAFDSLFWRFSRDGQEIAQAMMGEFKWVQRSRWVLPNSEGYR